MYRSILQPKITNKETKKKKKEICQSTTFLSLKIKKEILIW